MHVDSLRPFTARGMTAGLIQPRNGSTRGFETLFSHRGTRLENSFSVRNDLNTLMLLCCSPYPSRRQHSVVATKQKRRTKPPGHLIPPARITH